MTDLDILLADRLAEIRSEARAEARAEGRSEGLSLTLLWQIAYKWGKPSKRIEDTIKAGTDRQIRAWTAAILYEEKQADFLAAPDNPEYADR